MPVAKTVNPSVTIRKVTCHVPSFGGGRASGWRHRPLPVWVDCMLPLYTLQLAASCVRGECVGNMKASHLPNVLLYTIDMCAAPSAPSSKLKWDPQILHIYMNSSTRSFWHSWCSPFLLSISTGWRVPQTKTDGQCMPKSWGIFSKSKADAGVLRKRPAQSSIQDWLLTPLVRVCARKKHEHPFCLGLCGCLCEYWGCKDYFLRRLLYYSFLTPILPPYSIHLVIASTRQK